MKYELSFYVECSTDDEEALHKGYFNSWKVFNKEDFIRRFNILVCAYMDDMAAGKTPKIQYIREVGVSQNIKNAEEK